MSINNAFWSRCGVVSIDHVAVTTRSMLDVTKDYLSIPGSELLRGPGHNTSQNVDFSFVRASSGMVIEILGVRDDSPISGHVKNGGGAYHLCMTVNDLDSAVSNAVNEGAVVVVKPREDEAFDGRRVAFLMHRDHGLFEFLDAFPSDAGFENEYGLSGVGLTENAVKLASEGEAKRAVLQAFSNMFPDLSRDADIAEAEYGKTAGWDSLKHLQLIMEVERLSGVSVAAEDIADARSFRMLLTIVERKLNR